MTKALKSKIAYPQSESTRQWLRFSYSLFCYIAGVASLLYFIGFVNGYLPGKTVNSIAAVQSIPYAIAINLLAMSLFGLQHSVMARKSFKLWLQRSIHPTAERSTYCLATALAIGLMCYLWIPFGAVVWQVQSETAALLIRIMALLGWGFLLASTFALDHLHLFGLSQTYLPLRGKAMPTTQFKTPWMYRFVRHPIQTGVLIGMWCVPVATSSHLFFAGGMTLYILIGLYFEERDLINEFGEQYRSYMRRVKRVIPYIG